jgi:hypothetical protein
MSVKLRGTDVPELLELEKLLKERFPLEYSRKWSYLLLDGMVHGKDTCSHSRDETAWFSTGSKVLPLTLSDLLDEERLCPGTTASFQEGGAMQNWFLHEYASVLQDGSSNPS